ncbi:DNA polymerase alpha subunit B [Galendromus occidentalis]|uniref:DNA polymerase alpha subunit B n=1 Tax=Galendromus occidentalis TaxID=34638 RepID=A0AAJ6QUJ0_9ACAR|nr:DNA polymerase alpha subunit B [Galendromus occidentalis]
MDFTWDDVVQEFSLFGIEFAEDIIPERCLQFCKKHSLGPSDFCDAWVAWAKGAIITYNTETLEKMILDFEKQKQSVPPPPKTPSHGAQKRSVTSAILSPALSTPKRQNNGNPLCASFTDGTDSTPARVYKSGRRTGQVVASYKGRDFAEFENPQVKKIDSRPVNDVEVQGRLQNKNRTEMNLAVLERLGRMKESFALADKDLKDISGGFLSDGDIVYGMLRPPKRPNLPFLLYGDYEVSRSSSTPVFPKFPAFPGQVILAKVGNPANQARFLDESFEPELPPLPSPVNLKSGLRILVVAGPYTTLDTMSYEPYHDFIEQLIREEPDLAILVGPFVDANHKKLSTNLDCSFEEYFLQLIAHLENKLTGKNTRLYIVANHRENHGSSRAFPTERYCLPADSRVTCLNDPAILDVNGIQIGVSSTDIIRGMTESLVNVEENLDVNRFCARALLQQRSFYPLFPPHAELALRLPLLNRMMFDVRPHILVLPATVAPFAFEEERTMVVNPGSLVKGMDAGSYAILDIAPFKGDSVVDSSRVKVVRI